MPLKGGAKGKTNSALKSWVTFVKKVQKEENISYPEAMKRAKVRKSEWKRGGGDGTASDMQDPDAMDTDAMGTMSQYGDTFSGGAFSSSSSSGSSSGSGSASASDDSSSSNPLYGGRRRKRTKKRKGSKKRKGTKKRKSKRR